LRDNVVIPLNFIIVQRIDAVSVCCRSKRRESLPNDDWKHWSVLFSIENGVTLIVSLILDKSARVTVFAVCCPILVMFVF
jgi:hypothetical protein